MFKYEYVPTLFFVEYWVIRIGCPHCSLYFLDKIVKPYGAGMRAQPRRRNHLIGSKWLRTGEDEDDSFNGGATGPGSVHSINAQGQISSSGGVMSTNQGISTGKLPVIISNQLEGVNLGKSNIQGINVVADPIHVGTVMETSEASPLLVVDTKRRRTNEVVSIGPDGVGLQNSENMDILVCDDDTEEGSKNGLLGLGNPRAFQFISDLVIQKRPNLVFLCETLCRKNLVEKLRVAIGFEGMIASDARGHSGGVALLWRFSDEVVLLGYSLNYIDIKITTAREAPWRLTGFYGEPNRSFRARTWDQIRALKSDSPLPWCVIGDLNNVTSQADKRGYPFTWERGRGSNNWIEVRLDRVLASHDWTQRFISAQLFNLEVTISDHCPILLRTAAINLHHSVTNFRFENAWLREPLCRQVILDSWEVCVGLTLIDKIKYCGEKLMVWGQDYTVYTQREVFWRQRSKQLWLREGDQNSKFFHAKATARKKNNSINSLLNNSGVWVDWEGGLSDVIIDYFSDIFTSTSSNFDPVVSGIRPTITSVQNDSLLQQVTPEEIKKALFQMHPDKSPGPDGMTPGFYQKYWDVVGVDVISQVVDFFETCSFPAALNQTNIVLIPKKKHVTTMSDLTPISLCNVAYKVVSKVLANRLKIVLPNVISENQSAFISGRLISDNIMVAFEVMHYLKRKRKEKTGFMALKLDLSKAYDRIEWGFLKAMMLRMGFHPWTEGL
ncbi:uncharacterized protein LOC115713657 [Cannabis sativa]|uniref:uncharacterized protein LOC115713657 n=1 Tax=Cannabis sativa TaxID=3483 RepID=UPI0029C9BB4B|nr:uncharacterized protein LOC115713657 [Cannabis sativa]